jgi:alkyl hydroperoxide reductase subunit F
MDDLIIIGSGPAGLSAALFAARRGARITVLTKDTAWLDEMLEEAEAAGHSSLITGYDLLKALNGEVHKMKVRFIEAAASKVYSSNDIVMAETDKGVMTARAAIIATGRSLRHSPIRGAAALENRGISYWASINPEDYSGRTVAVVCAPETELRPLLQVLRLANKIILVGGAGDAALPHNARRMAGGRATEIIGRELVVGMKVAHGGGESIVDCDCVLLLDGFRPNSKLLAGGQLNQKGEIVIDKSNMSSVEGVFAAGDVTDVKEKQIFVALGEGAKAAGSALEYASAHPDAGYEAI